MDTRKRELERFKKEIDLREYAASVGYEVDSRKTTKRTAVMRCKGDKVMIRKDTDDHYIYCSYRDLTDNGTIIDFVKNRQSLNLGEIRKALRPWIGESAQPPKYKLRFKQKLEKTEKDREAVLAEYMKQDELETENRYLTNERSIPVEVYLGERFAGKINTDKYKNAIFPHYDDRGLCGFEKKNKSFTGFAKGGEKTVWFSNFFKRDTKMVIVESGIEALSHYALFKPENSRYVSMGGGWSPEAMKLVKKMMDEFSGDIVTAFNNDAGGWDMEKRFRDEAGDRSIISEYPEEVGQDWNEMLTNTIK